MEWTSAVRLLLMKTSLHLMETYYQYVFPQTMGAPLDNIDTCKPVYWHELCPARLDNAFLVKGPFHETDLT